VRTRVRRSRVSAAHGVWLGRRGSPGWVFRSNVEELAVLAAAFQRWRASSTSPSDDGDGDDDDDDAPSSGLARRPQLVLAFAVFDQDGNGEITSQELERVMGKGGMGSGCNREAFEEMVRTVSAKGAIDIRDFCRMMC